jgi:hypothetical protein
VTDPLKAVTPVPVPEIAPPVNVPVCEPMLHPDSEPDSNDVSGITAADAVEEILNISKAIDTQEATNNAAECRVFI